MSDRDVEWYSDCREENRTRAVTHVYQGYDRIQRLELYR